MVKNNISEQLINMFSYQHPLILSLTLELVYNLSFDYKFVLQIVAKPEFFKHIVGILKIQNLRGLILKIMFNISKEPAAKPLFSETDCMYFIYELLIKFPEPKIGIELAALTLNLTTYNKNAEVLAQPEKIQSLLERAFKFSDFHVIKIVRNILKFSEIEELNDYFEQQVDKFSTFFLTHLWKQQQKYF